MEKTTVREDNELIAEFMGWPRSQSGWGLLVPNMYPFIGYDTGWTECKGDQMDFHVRWDWLMPVVEKINTIYENGGMDGFDTDIYWSMLDWVRSVHISHAYADAVTIIKWYNTTKGR